MIRPPPLVAEPATAGATITFTEAQAAKAYGRDWMRSRQTDDAHKRLTAIDRLKAARAALSPQEAAVLDLAAGRGNTIAEIVAKTGRASGDIESLFLSACQKVAAHYEAQTESSHGQA